jgi:Transcriptional regulators
MKITDDPAASLCAKQDIAHEFGLTNKPCWRRIKRLEDSGVIARRVALVDAKKLDIKSAAFVTIGINSHNKDWLDTFSQCVKDIPEIIECHHMTGDVDYLLKIAIRDLAHYD